MNGRELPGKPPGKEPAAAYRAAARYMIPVCRSSFCWIVFLISLYVFPLESRQLKLMVNILPRSLLRWEISLCRYSFSTCERYICGCCWKGCCR